MEITNLVRPRTIDEAYRYLTEKNATLIGGGAWLRMSPRKIDTAVDLSSLALRYIRNDGDRIEVGAMATVRDVETSSLLEGAFGPLFRNAVGHIVGVQMRNVLSVGGTVAGRYGFSDLNTVLLALNAHVCLYKAGKVDFADFLSGGNRGPFLIEKIVLDAGRGAFQSIRNTRQDLPILNAAAAISGGSWRIAVGARPGPSRLAANAAEVLGTAARPEAAVIEKAAAIAAGEISFRGDIRATADYRQSVCATLVRRAITEVVA
ncbi:MAG TPA: FAD binding domain-containing protein [Spirochaetia bacterium]|nr:FAD binding domain-containing protein [Spirochaetia bacterium]